METYSLPCPYCGSPTEVTLEACSVNHDFVEDCVVCCSPILVTVACDPLSGERSHVVAVRENE